MGVTCAASCCLDAISLTLMGEGMVRTLILILSFPEKRDDYLTDIAILSCYVYIAHAVFNSASLLRICLRIRRAVVRDQGVRLPLGGKQFALSHLVDVRHRRPPVRRRRWGRLFPGVGDSGGILCLLLLSLLPTGERFLRRSFAAAFAEQIPLVLLRFITLGLGAGKL